MLSWQRQIAFTNNNLRCSVLLMLIVAVLYVTTYVSASSAPNGSSSQSEMPTATEVIERYLDATGGREAWSKLKSQYAAGPVEVPTTGDKGTFEVFANAPNKSLVVFRLTKAGEIRVGFDGKRGWSQTPREEAQYVRESSLPRIKRDADFHKYLNFSENFQSATVEGPVDLDGVKVYVVVATPVGEILPEKLYFDVGTGFLVRRDTSSEGGEGKKTSSVMYCSDYREIEGIKIPFSLRLVEDSVTFIIKFNDVKNNLSIEDAKFNLPPEADRQRTFSIALDHSLTPQAYIQKGLPAHDRFWAGSDYRQAASVLKQLSTSNPTLLPRHGSSSSGTMFARIVSSENLRHFGNETFTPQQRLQAAVPVIRGVAEILNVYSSISTPEKLFDSEVVELLTFTLLVSREVAKLSDVFLASLSADDPSREDLLKALEQIRQGLASIVSGCLGTLTEKGNYRISELIRLAEKLETTLPATMNLLPPGTQQEVPARLQRMIEQEIDPALKDRLTRIAKAIAKARASARPSKRRFWLPVSCSLTDKAT